MAHKFLRLGCFNAVDVQTKKKTDSAKIIISGNDNKNRSFLKGVKDFNRKCSSDDSVSSLHFSFSTCSCNQ